MSAAQDEIDDSSAPLIEHLAELRTRIIVSSSVVAVMFVVCYVFSNQIFDFIAYPLKPLQAAGDLLVEQADKDGDKRVTYQELKAQVPDMTRDQFDRLDRDGDGVLTTSAERARNETLEVASGPTWKALNPLEPFWVKLKLALYAAIVLSLPVILMQIRGFIFPGLKPVEQKVVSILVFGCSGLAIAGVLVAYFQVLPYFMPMVMSMAPPEVVVELRMNETVSLIVRFILGFAIAFQFPMLAFILVYLDLLSPATLRQQRKVAWVILAIAAAILTPGPDIFSMLAMMMPLVVLYEGSIWISYLIVWRKARRAAEEAAA